MMKLENLQNDGRGSADLPDLEETPLNQNSSDIGMKPKVTLTLV